MPTTPQLLTFLNAFTLLNDANRLAVFAAGADSCHLAYCSPSCTPAPVPAVLSAAAAAEPAAPDPWPPAPAILQGLQRIHGGISGGDSGGGGTCQLSSALSRALCFIHSLQRRAAAAHGALLGGSSGGGAPPEGQQPARLLCVCAAPDTPSQYIGVMNAIFSAQVGAGVWVGG